MTTIGRALLTGTAAVAVAGLAFQAIATRIDRRRYPPPGRLIDVGGHSLHVQVAGERHTGPTVLLEAGMDSFSTNWHWVQVALASSHRVVAYDRAGLGWSDTGSPPRDARRSAEELHRALRAGGLAGPYVVVGHSYGGLVVRAFTDLFPDEVVGMVLVDASHPDQWARIPASLNGHVTAWSNRVLGALAWFGVLRVCDVLTPQVAAGLPPRQYAAMKAIFALPRSSMTGADGLDVWNDVTRPAINAARPLGSLPLAVLGVTEQPLYGGVLSALQSELSALSTNSMHCIIQGATHETLISNPVHAAVVVEAIRRVADTALQPATGRRQLT